MRIFPPRGAYWLTYFLAFLLVPIVTTTIVAIAMGWREISGLPLYISLTTGALVAVPVTIWFVKKQWIQLAEDKVVFSFTRYLIPKIREAAYKDIRRIVFHDGVFGRDGKPRPYTYVERSDGSRFWVPMPIFGRRDLGKMLEVFAAKGLPLEIEGQQKFVTRTYYKK